VILVVILQPMPPTGMRIGPVSLLVRLRLRPRLP
jgi:hypothetical protein